MSLFIHEFGHKSKIFCNLDSQKWIKVQEVCDKIKPEVKLNFI